MENVIGKKTDLERITRRNDWHRDERRWIQSFKTLLEREYKTEVEEAIIFGSKARGEGTTESDIDILLVLAQDAVGRETRIKEAGYDLMAEEECWNVLPVLFTTTRESWREASSKGYGFCRAVETEGIRFL